MQSHITMRSKALPTAMRQSLIDARRTQGWTQAELGKRVGLPQMHISGIETGRVVPRFDTLLDLVRVLGFDLLLVPRDLVPVVQSLSRLSKARGGRTNSSEEDEEPLYKPDEDDEQPS